MLKRSLALLLLALLLSPLGCRVRHKHYPVQSAATPVASLTYSPATFTFRVGTPITPSLPSTSGGAPAVFELAPGSPALPAGITLDANTGALIGTPSVSGGGTIVVITARNDAGSAVAVLTVNVLEQLPCILGYDEPSPDYHVGRLIQDNVPAVDPNCGPADTFSIDPALPAGLSFDPATGIISGIPTELLEDTDFTVTVSNSGGSDSTVVTVRVMPVFTFIASDQTLLVDPSAPPTFVEPLSILEDPMNPGFPNPIHAFVMGVTHDPNSLDLLDVQIGSALALMGTGPDFVQFTETNSGFFAGVVIDFDLVEFLEAGNLAEVLTVEYQVLATPELLAGSPVSIPLTFEDGLAAPPANADNAIASGMQGVLPDFTHGTIMLMGTAP